MTRIERLERSWRKIEKLEQSWRNLEYDVRSKHAEANALLTTLAATRRLGNPGIMFPSLQSTGELAVEAEIVAYASVLDLVHTTMRELGLQYD